MQNLGLKVCPALDPKQGTLNPKPQTLNSNPMSFRIRGVGISWSRGVRMEPKLQGNIQTLNPKPFSVVLALSDNPHKPKSTGIGIFRV